jgi:hypothetical protein
MTYSIPQRSVQMLILGLCIGHSGHWAPEYLDSGRLVGVGIGPRYSASISHVGPSGKKIGQAMSRGIGGDWLGIRSVRSPRTASSSLEHAGSRRNPTAGGGGSGTPPSRPPALHLRLRTDPSASALPSYPSASALHLTFSNIRGRFRRCSGDHLPSSGDLRLRRFVP